MTIDAEDLFVRHFLGILTPEQKDATARWIRARQREDGSWATFYAGPADLSTTVEAYVALRLAGDPPDAVAHARGRRARPRPRRRRAHARLHAHVALAALALVVGRSARAAARADPAAGARAALHLLVRLLGAADARRALDRVGAAAERRRPVRDRRASHRRRAGDADRAVGAALHVRRPRPAPLRAEAGCGAAPPGAARGRAMDRRAPGGGRLLGRDPAAVGLVDHRAARARLPARPSGDRARARRARQLHDRGRAGPARSRRASRRSGTPRSPCSRCSTRASSRVTTPSPAARAGSPAARCACAATGRCGGRNSSRAGSRSSSRTTTTPTSTTRPSSCSRCGARDRRRRSGRARRRVVARHAVERRRLGGVRRRQHEPPAREAAVLRLRRGHRSAERGRDGAHGRDARVRGTRGRTPATQRGIDWLLREQERDGSWFGRWGANHVYGTGAVASGARRVRPRRAIHSVRAAVALARAGAERRRRLRRGPPLVPRRAWRGRGASTASQTAWALLGLHAAGEHGRGGRARGATGSSSTQRTDGSWDEPYFTGTGFPGDFYINYHLYRQVFPVMALGAGLDGVATCSSSPRSGSRRRRCRAAPGWTDPAHRAWARRARASPPREALPSRAGPLR